MAELCYFSHAQIALIKCCFFRSHGVPRGDDRRYHQRDHSCHQERSAMEKRPPEYEPYTMRYNRFIRWSRLGGL